MLIYCEMCESNFVACCGINCAAWNDWYYVYHSCPIAKINGYSNPFPIAFKPPKTFIPLEIHFLRVVKSVLNGNIVSQMQHIFNPTCIHKSHDKLGNGKFPLMQQAWWT